MGDREVKVGRDETGHFVFRVWFLRGEVDDRWEGFGVVYGIVAD